MPGLVPPGLALSPLRISPPPPPSQWGGEWAAATQGLGDQSDKGGIQTWRPRQHSWVPSLRGSFVLTLCYWSINLPTTKQNETKETKRNKTKLCSLSNGNFPSKGSLGSWGRTGVGGAGGGAVKGAWSGAMARTLVAPPSPKRPAAPASISRSLLRWERIRGPCQHSGTVARTQSDKRPHPSPGSTQDLTPPSALPSCHPTLETWSTPFPPSAGF